MKYFEVNMTIEPCTQDAQDLLAALAGEAGFETFEETTDGLKGYVQQALFDEETLKSVLDGFPIEFFSCPVYRYVIAVYHHSLRFSAGILITHHHFTKIEYHHVIHPSSVCSN